MTLLNDIIDLHDKWDAKGGHSGYDKYEDALYDCINDLGDVILKHERVNEEQRKRELMEKVEREKAEAEERERQKALMSDKSKLLLFADRICGLTASNLDVKSPEARELFHTVLNGIANVEESFREGIENL